MKVGDYLLEGELGRGGMGVVYRGRGPRGEVVAIKLLLAERPGSRERFQRERRLLATLGEAEGFVPLLAQGELAGARSFIVMPFVGGGTLREKLREGPLSIEDTLAIGRAVASAAGRAHALGIVHRDLKPENILFETSGVPLVADLGLAKHFGAGPGASQTIALSKTGEMRGTVGYLPPEQVEDAKNAGPAADVFSLGAILYECLAGVPAFLAENPHAIIAAIVEGRKEPLRKLRKDTPPWLASAIEKALATDPAKRFADGTAFAEALAGPSPLAPRRKGLVVGLGLGLLAGAAALAVTLSPRAQPQVPVAKPPPPAAPPPPAPPESFPSICSKFLKTEKTRLAGVWGGYSWHQTYKIMSVAVSPDERVVATCSERGEVKLWDLATGNDLRLLGSAGAAAELAFAHEGDELVVAAAPGTMAWSLAGKTPPRLLDSRSGALALPRARVLLFGADAPTDIRWRSADVHEITLGDAPAVAAAATPDGRFVALASTDGVSIFDVEQKVRIASLEDAAATTIAISKDGRRIVTGGAGRRVRLWDASTGSSSTLDHEGAATVAFAGERVVSVGSGLAATWDAATGRELARATLAATRAVPLRDGRLLVAGGDSCLRLLDLETLAGKAGPGGHTGFVERVVPVDAERVLTASRDGTVRLWSSGRLATTFPVSSSSLHSLAVSPDGKRFLAGSSDRRGHLWDLAARKELRVLGEHGDLVAGAAFFPDGRRALTTSWDGSIKAWDVASGIEVGTFSGSPGGVTGVATLGATSFMTASNDGAVFLWDLGRSEPRRLETRQGRCSGLAVSPDGRRALTTSSDRTVAAWNLSPAEVVRVLQGHTDEVYAAAFSPDGKRGASVGQDLTVRLWELDSGRELDRISLEPASDAPLSVAFSTDGRQLLVGTARGVVLAFALDPK